MGMQEGSDEGKTTEIRLDPPEGQGPDEVRVKLKTLN